MAFRRQVLLWAECDLCEYETPKDDGTKDRYLKLYLKHLKETHPVAAAREIKDLEALISPFEPYKVAV